MPYPEATDASDDVNPNGVSASDGAAQSKPPVVSMHTNDSSDVYHMLELENNPSEIPTERTSDLSVSSGSVEQIQKKNDTDDPSVYHTLENA